ncbi:WRKY Transcription Factor [Trifolium repens]|nr:putative WRKY transcription factor [Trifolium repens]WJX34564.1 WRKY Transcription Factor [Trifolium repens]
MDISYFGNPNPSNPYHHYNNNNIASSSSSDFINLSDYLVLDDVVFVDSNNNNNQEYYSSWSQSSETEQSSDKAASSSTTTTDVVINQGLISDETSINNNNMTTTTTTTMQVLKRKNEGIKENTIEVSPKITFRTRSQLEIMDDGYKWRKYGKKSVKNSPNPRNYYKCSGERCGVKKRVERDREDSSYVLTTYEGVHTHESPCTSYYTSPMSSNLIYSNQWPSTNSSSSN